MSNENENENIIYVETTEDMKVAEAIPIIQRDEVDQSLVISNLGSAKQLSEYISDPFIYLVHIIYENYGIGPASDYCREIIKRSKDLNEIFNIFTQLQQNNILGKKSKDKNDQIIEKVKKESAENLPMISGEKILWQSEDNEEKIIYCSNQQNKNFDKDDKYKIKEKILVILSNFKDFFNRIYENIKNNEDEALYENPIINNYLMKIENELKELDKNLYDNCILKKISSNKYNSFSNLELKWKIRKYWVNYFIDNFNINHKNNNFKKLLKDNNLYKSTMKSLKNDDIKLLDDIKKNEKLIQQNHTRLSQSETDNKESETEDTCSFGGGIKFFCTMFSNHKKKIAAVAIAVGAKSYFNQN